MFYNQPCVGLHPYSGSLVNPKTVGSHQLDVSFEGARLFVLELGLQVDTVFLLIAAIHRVFYEATKPTHRWVRSHHQCDVGLHRWICTELKKVHPFRLLLAKQSRARASVNFLLRTLTPTPTVEKVFWSTRCCVSLSSRMHWMHWKFIFLDVELPNCSYWPFPETTGVFSKANAWWWVMFPKNPKSSKESK